MYFRRDTHCQFHQYLTSSFCAHRSQKCKKTQKIIFVLLGSVHVKDALKIVDEIDPRFPLLIAGVMFLRNLETDKTKTLIFAVQYLFFASFLSCFLVPKQRIQSNLKRIWNQFILNLFKFGLDQIMWVRIQNENSFGFSKTELSPNFALTRSKFSVENEMVF